MTLRNRRLAIAIGAVVAVTTLGLGGAGVAAQAAPRPGQLPPDATICTDQIRADAGVSLSGSTDINAGSGIVWTVRAASAAGGPESEVLRTPGRTLRPTAVVPPVPGTWFFRGCAWNSQPFAVTVQQLQISPL
jgi:hypothetical protein